MKVEFAAADMTERLAPFRAVLEHGGVRDALDRLCAAEWRRGTGQAVRARALKWHGDRCTFEIALRTEEGWHSVIGKVYTGHRSDVFWAMQALGQAGFGPEADFSIAQPFVYLASLGVRLEEKVQGPSAKEIFLNGGPDLHLAAAERCGQWLARFHRTAPPLGHVADLAAEFSRYRYWTDLIARLGEPLAAKAERLFRRLEAVAPTAGALAGCMGHGSYIPEHVILSGRRTATIDLDDYDVGDPGRDVAWFLVSLRRLALKHLGSLHGLDGAGERFGEAYRASGRGDAVMNLAFYTALECLHGAKRDAVSQAPRAREWADAMLDEGLGALDSARGRMVSV